MNVAVISVRGKNIKKFLYKTMSAGFVEGFSMARGVPDYAENNYWVNLLQIDR